MQRFLKNLMAVVAMGLISLTNSFAMAHGGGGGHGGGGHSSAGRSSSGRSSSIRNTSHVSQNHVSHKNMSKSKGANKSVAHKDGHRPPRHPPRHHPPYHMHYPVSFWFGGDIDDGDADAVEGGIDVEFTSIRQLDAGDPAKNLAPAYRVWFHNNSTVDIDQPFDVAILASMDQSLTENLPYASVRVEGLAADETTSVDIRLPIDAMNMGSDGDQAAPYSFLHTIIDSQRELVETNKANNLSVYDRNDIPALEE